jgi:hypothetical protein
MLKQDLHDVLGSQVDLEMSPIEKSSYEQEKREYYRCVDEYNNKWMAWAMKPTPGSSAPDATPPDITKFPMVQERERRVKELERQVTDQVRSEMSQYELEQLGIETTEWLNALQRVHQQMASGVFSQMPKPPRAVQGYFEKVMKATRARVCGSNNLASTSDHVFHLKRLSVPNHDVGLLA